MSTRNAAARALPRSPAPRIHRRVSGPVARPAQGFTLPQPQPLHLPRVERFLDRLLRSRAWISVIGIGLMGIVAMQVSLLKLNTGISRAVQTSTTLERQNAMLESQLARMGSNERISAVALKRGMVAPPAGSVVFVRARPETDAVRAARRIQPPSESALALMANGGRVPGAIAAADAAAAVAAGTTAAVTTTTAVAPVQETAPVQPQEQVVVQQTAGTAVVPPAQP